MPTQSTKRGKMKRPRKNRWGGKCETCGANHFRHRRHRPSKGNMIGAWGTKFPSYSITRKAHNVS